MRRGRWRVTEREGDGCGEGRREGGKDDDRGVWGMGRVCRKRMLRWRRWLLWREVWATERLTRGERAVQRRSGRGCDRGSDGDAWVREACMVGPLWRRRL